MFAIPGIVVLIAFIYIRPQEFVDVLQRAPFLYIFFALAVFGFIVDLRLRVSKLRAVPQLPWVVLFGIWGLTTVLVKAPQQFGSQLIELAVPIALFLIIAHATQTFRAFQIVVGALLAITCFLAAVGVQQGLAPTGCVVVDDAHPQAALIPDGRPCKKVLECYRDPEPGADYSCEHVGLFGTTSIGGRIRYRGVLQDPNELALALGIGLAFAFGFFDRRRSLRRLGLLLISFVLVLGAVIFSESRGGELVFLSVIGAYFIKRYRWSGVLLGAVLAVPMLLLSHNGQRTDARSSTDERLDAWSVGISLFREHPVLGVGQGQFTEHHYLTAHNSYVLVPAECGFIGMLLWSIVVYLSVKILVQVLRGYAGHPDAEAARTWAMALLAAQAGLYVGSLFLSFAYHHVLWIYLGLSGALYSAVKTHDPSFRVRLSWLEVFLIAAADLGFLALLYVYLRLRGY